MIAGDTETPCGCAACGASTAGGHTHGIRHTLHGRLLGTPRSRSGLPPSCVGTHGTQQTTRRGVLTCSPGGSSRGVPGSGNQPSPSLQGRGNPGAGAGMQSGGGRDRRGSHGSSSNSMPWVLPALTCSHRSILRCHLLLLFRQAFTRAELSGGNRSTRPPPNCSVTMNIRLFLAHFATWFSLWPSVQC